MLAAIGTLAERVKGFPWTRRTVRSTPRPLWTARTLELAGRRTGRRSARNMHAYRDGKLIRVVTLGMSKFGYPDLVVNQVASGTTSAIGNLLNLAAQTIVEQGALAKASTLEVSLDKIGHPGAKAEQNTNIHATAKRWAAIPVAFVEPEEGDADNRLIELLFVPQPGEAVQAAQSRTVDLVYGSHDEVTLVAHDDRGGASGQQAGARGARRAQAERRGRPEVRRATPGEGAFPHAFEQHRVDVGRARALGGRHDHGRPATIPSTSPSSRRGLG